MKNLICLLAFCFASCSFGQEWVDLANVYWRTSPINSTDSTANKWTLNTYSVDLKAPVVLNDQNVLIFGVEFQQNYLSISQTGSIPIKFSSSMLQIGFEHKWNEKSKMMFMSMTRFNSDFKFVDINHFQQGGLILGTTSRSANFDWKYGLYYNAEFFGPMFVPLLGFNWKINDKWRFKMVIPVNFELSYQAKDWVRTGLRFDGVNASYRTNLNTGLLGANSYHIDKADNNLWVFTEFHLGKNIWIHVKAGYSIFRKYRVYNDSEQMSLKLGPVNIGENRPVTERMFKNGMSFEARFIYRLPLE